MKGEKPVLDSILETGAIAGMTPVNLILCSLTSLAMGFVVALLYMYRNRYSKSFVCTLVLLPAMVQIVIMAVNGNLGAGVAVMGAFSLVRFRSIPGSARDISSIFFAMAIGLTIGMGYLGVALLFLILVGGANLLLSRLNFGQPRKKAGERELRITIPEDLEAGAAFEEVFRQYTKKAELMEMKTSNMGSLYELRYLVELSDNGQEKQFIDDLRCRNGNLRIISGRPSPGRDEL